MCGRLYLNTMHVDCANLIIQYLSIWWFDLENEHTIATVTISRSFLWYAMNELMHVVPEQIDFQVHEWSLMRSESDTFVGSIVWKIFQID